MERPNAKGSQNFMVGLFVFIAMLVSAGFVVFMGQSVFGSEFRLRALFNDVRGLNIGAPVFLSGIQVGRVSEKQFPANETEGQDHQIIVVLSIYEEHRDRVKKDSEVTITTQGVLGDKVVVLTSGSKSAKGVKDNQFLPSIQPRELEDFFAEGGSLVESLAGASRELNILLKSLNESGRLPRILENFEKTTKHAREIAARLDDSKTLQNLDATLASLSKVMAKVDQGKGTLGALINDPTLHEDLRVLLGGAQRSKTIHFLLKQAISSADEKKPAGK
jgi:phospholipid/cholesterol/gamma-HCH transport system substrate-binding protein